MSKAIVSTLYDSEVFKMACRQFDQAADAINLPDDIRDRTDIILHRQHHQDRLEESGDEILPVRARWRVYSVLCRDNGDPGVLRLGRMIFRKAKPK